MRVRKGLEVYELSDKEELVRIPFNKPYISGLGFVDPSQVENLNLKRIPYVSKKLIK